MRRKVIKKHRSEVKETVSRQTGMSSLPALHARLEAQAAEISFVYGSGRHKSEKQRQWEAFETLYQRWVQYEQSLSIMGETCNSCSKTDPDAASRRKANIRPELFFLALTFDLKKLWMKRKHGRLKSRASEELIS